MWDSTILLIIVVGYPLSDIEVSRPKLEYGIFRLTPIAPSKINHSFNIEQVNSKIEYKYK
jgi:hypothetical protein